MAGLGAELVNLIGDVPGLATRFGEVPRWMRLLQLELDLWLDGAILVTTELNVRYEGVDESVSDFELVVLTDRSVAVVSATYQSEGAPGWPRPVVEVAPLAAIESLVLTTEHGPRGSIGVVTAGFAGIGQLVRIPMDVRFVVQDADDFNRSFTLLRDAYFAKRSSS